MARSHPMLAPSAPDTGATARPRAARSSLRRRFEQGGQAVPLALAPAFLLAALASVPTPLEPLAEAIMQRTPVSLVAALLSLLGGLSRTFALLGAIAVTLPVGGLLALLALLAPPSPCATGSRGRALPGLRRSLRWMPSALTSNRVPPRWLGWLAVLVLAVLCVLPLVLAAPYPAQAVAALLVAACYIPALLLVRRVPAARLASPGDGATSNLGDTSATRRAFLRAATVRSAQLAGFVALASFDLWSTAFDTVLSRGQTIRRLFTFVPPAPRAGGFPVDGLAPEVTPISRFYLLSKNDVDPAVAPQDWLLRVDGAVDRPFTLSYEELLALPRANQYVTLRCVSNPPNGPLMSNAYWTGVPLAALLRRAGADPTAAAIAMTAPDDYAEVAPLAAALADSALLAYGMNGETLPRAHGGPVRLILPGYFGFKNVKWVERITITRTLPSGYWSARGWTASLVHGIARIDVATPTAAGLLAAGFAFTGALGVSAVQLQADGGPWQHAALNIPALSPYTWVQWRLVLRLPPGPHTLTARVIDAAGRAQEPATTSVYPNGATGLDTIHITL